MCFYEFFLVNSYAADKRCNELIKNKYNTVGTVPSFKRKMVERGIIDTPNTRTYIHYRS